MTPIEAENIAERLVKVEPSNYTKHISVAGYIIYSERSMMRANERAAEARLAIVRALTEHV